MNRCVIPLLAALLSATPLPAAPAPGYETLYRLDTLPQFKSPLSIGAVTSYDRSGGNDDGFSGRYSFVRKEADALVLADLQGPGVIYRVWTPTPSEDLLEFYFDGETSPRIHMPFRELFLGRQPGFPAPLVGFGAGGYFCYVPIPFAKSCVVRMRAERTQFYQIHYARYPAETQLTSFSPDTDAAPARELFLRAGQDISSYTLPPNASPILARKSLTVHPGKTAEIFHSRQGGRIFGLRFSPSEAMAGKARDLILRISFDDASPSVVCPIGDFFGYAWGQPAMQSLLVGTTGTTNYAYFPMPYKTSARIEVLSERPTPVDLHAEILHTPRPQTADEGRFYAVWRRENPTRLGHPYTFLETAGRGHLVGVILQAQGLESGKTLFFEGDDATFIDGELLVHGTGSEDFFNGGWYDVPDRWEKRISLPLSGCLGYAKHLGRTGGYRLLLGDAYSFRHKLLQTIEHAGEHNSIPTDYCSVSFFYADTPPTPEPSLLPLSQRAVHDPREIIFPTSWQTPIYAWSFNRATLTRKNEKIGGEETRYLSLRAEGDDWFGPHFISFTCEVPESGAHDIFIETIKGPTQAIVQLFQNENPTGPSVDLFAPEPVKSGRLFIGSLSLAEGRNNLMLKLVGKNDQSAALGLDITHIICVRK